MLGSVKAGQYVWMMRRKGWILLSYRITPPSVTQSNVVRFVIPSLVSQWTDIKGNTQREAYVKRVPNVAGNFLSFTESRSP